jgi:hypothetical protein
MEYGLVTPICDPCCLRHRSIAEGSVILICGVCASVGERTFSANQTDIDEIAIRSSLIRQEIRDSFSQHQVI